MNTYTFHDIPVGLTACFTRSIGLEDIKQFSRLTGDENPLHLDPQYAETTPFKQQVVFGMLVQSYLSTLAGMYLPGKYALILSSDAQFRKPVFLNDTVKITGTVTEKIAVGKIIILGTTITNQHEDVVVNGKMRVQVLQ